MYHTSLMEGIEVDFVVFVFLMQCSCQPKFHVCDYKVLTYLLVCLVQVRLGTEVLRTPSSTQPRFELTTSRL